MSEQKLRQFLRRATAGLKAANDRIRELEEAPREPIAIVSMACRFPGGVRSAQDLGDLVASGRDAIGEFPADRGWDLDALFDPTGEAPATSYTRSGGFLDGAAEFDAEFFGISPREAVAVDPQHRLLLETAWELVECAHLDPATLRGSRTGVFAGAMYQDYLAHVRDIPDGLEGYLGTGASASVLSGRLAYTLGLEGAAVSVDTACSSSLVAIHLAGQSLRTGECTLAVAGGVTVMSNPQVFVEMSRQRGLSPDGRCKSFADNADGTGLSEGVGLLLLERLSDAQRNGHQVLAVIRGSAINQDGASNGLTAPNGPSQRRVIRQALASAGLSGVDVDAVEAHGTGTMLGDPIEAQALLATYGQNRPSDRPLWLGSIKSNLGHAQAAAGVAGVIKMALGLRHGILPRTLHIDQPSSHVDWSAGTVRLLTEARDWPLGDQPRRAGISSFGISGTNAHLIIEEAPAQPARPHPGSVPAVLPVVVSGRGVSALRAQAQRLRGFVAADPDVRAEDVAFSLTARSAFEHRAVVLCTDRDSLLAGLSTVADGSPGDGVLSGVSGDRGKTAFVFGGQGSQWAGMGLVLSASSTVFSAAMRDCAAALSAFVDWDLFDVLGDELTMRRVDVVQPALFAVMVSLARLWESVGVRPSAVVGHSQGEIAAACVAGLLSLEDAARIVALRSQALLDLSGRGGMASVALPVSSVDARIASSAGRLSLAAVNGPDSVVVSGEPDALAELVSGYERDGVRARLLPVDYASHSVQVEQVRARLLTDLESVAGRQGRVPMWSTVTGEPIAGTQLDAEHWYRNLRETVRFEDVTRGLADAGFGTFVELSPHPVLTVAVEQTLDAAGQDGVVVGSLRRDDGDADRFIASAAELHAAGVPIDWSAVLAGSGAHRIELPTYAFQRERYWLDSASWAADASSLGLVDADHPLLGAGVELPGSDGWLWTGRLSQQSHPWLADHAVNGTVLLAGTALLELAWHAGDHVGCPVVEELNLQAPLVLPAAGAIVVQVLVDTPDESGGRQLTVHSRQESVDAPWTLVASGLLRPDVDPVPPDAAGEWPPRGATPLDISGIYHALAAAGTEYGPAFQGLRRAWRLGEDVLVEVSLDTGDRFGVHPALLDAALHGLSLDDRFLLEPGRVHLPFSWRDARFHRAASTSLRVRLSPVAEGVVSVRAVDEDGRPVVTVASLVLRPLQSLGGAAPDALFAIDWQPATAGAVPEWVVLEDVGSLPDPVPVCVALPVHGAAGVDVVCGVLAVLREWLGDKRCSDSRLVVVTQGSAGDAVWGLVRSAQAEHPGRFGLVDVDVWDDAPVGLALGEPECLVRDGRPLVPRLARRATSEVDGGWGSGAVVITGGLSGLGAVVARHVVGAGVRRLVLVGRRGLTTPGAADLVAELREQGAAVSVAACDVADRAALAEVFAVAGHVTGVVHAAGVLDDGVVESLSADQVRRVWRAKVEGAWHLHELTSGADLSAFVVFSSAAATLGSAGQGAYAAANAGLEQLVRHRRSLGLSGVAIGWGLWEAATGMTGGLDDAGLARMARKGVLPLPTDHGLWLLDAAMRLEDPVVVAARLNPPALRTLAADGMLPPMLRGMVRTAARRSDVDTTGLRARLGALTEEEQAKLVLELVREHAAAVLGHSSGSAIVPERAFKDLGFDSLTAVEFRNRLTATTGLRLPATLVFDHPTPAVLTRHLHGQLSGGTTDPGVRPPTSAIADDEPIAIVSMACRYPGEITSPEDLWRVVSSGRDVISDLPTDRGWDPDELYDPDPDRSGKSYVRSGGFVYDAADFDAGFFAISPREALAMDPQQRLLLEATWEVVERAGIDPISLRGSQSGVFAGVMYHDYIMRLESVPDGLEGYVGTGGLGSVVSGRVAYSFGLEGPAVTVDTACSSSLVAIHLACQSLRSGECSLALAGGVSVMATPMVFVAYSRQRGLAADGRCKSFASAADGTAWAEGVGVVLLERLSDARRNGHRVLALIRGSAVNQDGASNGLSAPNGPSQQRVIRQALANARLTTADVDVVEAHGTGTMLGDPIEAQALLATYGQDRDQPLWLGSIKSNMGHAQAAAGVAGVIKMVEAIRHGEMPVTLHVDEPTSQVDWSAGRVELLTQAQPWPDTGRPRRAGVSSFGISGTNAHLILEQNLAEEPSGPVEPPLPPPVDHPVPLVISGHTAPALRAQAAKLASTVAADPGHRPVDVAWSLVTTRAAFEHRGVVIGADRHQLLGGLAALASGEPDADVISGAVGEPGAVAMVFGGQGSQWVGMGLELSRSSPVFAAALHECSEALSSHVDWKLMEALADESALARVDVLQPALFAVTVSLARLWFSCGVRPGAVVGLSQGEIVAAHIAGALPLDDAARLVSLRSQAGAELSDSGGMMSVALPVDDAVSRIAPWGDRLSVGAVNGPRSVVVSGEFEALHQLAAELRTSGVRARMVPAAFASHSAQVERIRDRLMTSLGSIEPASVEIPMWSTVTGAPVDGTELTADYWYRNLRDTVRFEPVIRALAGSGFSAFIEAGPHPVVAAAIEDTLDSCDRTATVIGSLRRDHGDLRDFTISLAHAHTTGVDIDWSSQLVDSSPKPVELPTYAFQRQRFWLDAGPVPSTTRHDDLPEVRADDPVDTLAALRRRLVEKSATEQDRILTELVSTHLAAVLGHESARAIPPRQEFKALGMDSLTAVNLRNRLGGATGLRLPVSLAFDHPTASAVAAYLRAELLDDEQADSLPEQIDRLERALAALRPDDPVRTGQLFRLRELASTLAGPQPDDPDGGLAARFESSTNDEIFRYLDVQLGGS